MATRREAGAGGDVEAVGPAGGRRRLGTSVGRAREYATEDGRLSWQPESGSPAKEIVMSAAPTVRRSGRRLVRRSGILVGALAVLGGTAIPAVSLISKPPPSEDRPDPSTGAAGDLQCPSGHPWTSMPRIVLHTSEYTSGGGTSADATRMLTAVKDVVDQFNAIGATSAKITKVQTSTSSFTFGKWIGDSTPTIHVGWTNDIASIDGPAGAITRTHPDSHGCVTEAHIKFPTPKDPVDIDWDFDTPFDTTGSPAFYDAGTQDGAGKTWFRPSFQHELLHAWSFVHTKTEYSYMNHRSPGGFPWANRPAAESVRLLPWEIGQIRMLYPLAKSSH
jgi:hypothetical protein